MKIKFPKTKKNFKKGSHTVNPDFFWQLLLIFAGCMILASFVAGVLVFRNVTNDAAFDDAGTVSKPSMVRKARIDAVLGYFADREKKSTDILNSPSPVIDPSR